MKQDNIVVTLSLGANIGDKINNLKRVLIMLEDKIGKIVSFSKIYESEAWGFESSDTFYNQIINISTALNPEDLLAQIWEIERAFGRTRVSVEKEVDNYKERLKSEKICYLSRTMDIDIIYYGDKVINTNLLNIPHRYVDKRMFVLEPMVEIMPNFIDPLRDITIKEMYDLFNKKS